MRHLTVRENSLSEGTYPVEDYTSTTAHIIIEEEPVDTIEQISFNVSEVVIEKKKKVRRKKIVPDFYQMETSGSIDKLVVRGMADASDILAVHSEPNNDLMLSPYSSLIPISYLEQWDRDIYASRYTEISRILQYSKILKYEAIKKGGLLSLFIGYLIGKCKENGFIYNVDDKEHASSLLELINDWFLFDKPVFFKRSLLNMRGRINDYVYPPGICGFFDISGEQNRDTYHMRSYSLRCSSLTACTTCESEIISVAVIKPEDYLYQKYHILIHGCIDLRYVTVLVDREIDSTSYKIPALRKKYKTEMEPFLKTLACNVWKVPQEFIQENCFVKKSLFTSNIPMKRKEEKKSLIRDFYGYLKGSTEEVVPESMANVEVQEEDIDMRDSTISQGTISQDDTFSISPREITGTAASSGYVMYEGYTGNPGW